MTYKPNKPKQTGHQSIEHATTNALQHAADPECERGDGDERRRIQIASACRSAVIRGRTKPPGLLLPASMDGREDDSSFHHGDVTVVETQGASRRLAWIE